MTVEVDTPEGLRLGTSVLEVQGLRTNNLDTGGQGSRVVLQGEAAAVDLGNGKMIFALLRLANSSSADDTVAVMSMRAMDPSYENDKKDSAQRIASSSGIISPAVVLPKDYPLLVTFAEIDDPRTVQRVDPADLAASVGTGVNLKRIFVEKTEEPLTRNIDRVLPWRRTIGDHRLNGDRFEDFRKSDLAAHLSAFSFSTRKPT